MLAVEAEKKKKFLVQVSHVKERILLSTNPRRDDFTILHTVGSA